MVVRELDVVERDAERGEALRELVFVDGARAVRVKVREALLLVDALGLRPCLC